MGHDKKDHDELKGVQLNHTSHRNTAWQLEFHALFIDLSTVLIIFFTKIQEIPKNIFDFCSNYYVCHQLKYCYKKEDNIQYLKTIQFISHPKAFSTQLY